MRSSARRQPAPAPRHPYPSREQKDELATHPGQPRPQTTPHLPIPCSSPITQPNNQNRQLHGPCPKLSNESEHQEQIASRSISLFVSNTLRDKIFDSSPTLKKAGGHKRTKTSAKTAYVDRLSLSLRRCASTGKGRDVVLAPSRHPLDGAKRRR